MSHPGPMMRSSMLSYVSRTTGRESVLLSTLDLITCQAVK